MATQNSTLPLHKITHFRRMREVLIELAKKEKININDYDLNNIRCYREHGNALNGNNVTFANIPTHRSCFASSIYFNMYEIPHKSNKVPYEGKYLFLAQSPTYDFYLFGTMEYNISGVKKSGLLDATAKFNCFGEYIIANFDSHNFKITKTRKSSLCDDGDKYLKSTVFDSANTRLLSGYKVTLNEVIGAKIGKQLSRSNINSNEQVKIYKKQKTTRRYN